MSFAPVNYCAFMDLVPIYEWETCDPAEAAKDGAPPPAPVPSTSGADVPPSDAPPSNAVLPDDAAQGGQDPRRKLVFVGFQWRPAFSVATFPSPAWLEGIMAGSTEEADASRQREVSQRRAAEANRARSQAPGHDPVPSPAPEVDTPASASSSPAEDE